MQGLFVLSLDLCWGILLAFGAYQLVATARRGLDRDTLTCLALFALALGLRLALATWGPGDFQMKQRWVFEPGKPLDFFRGNSSLILAQWLFMVLPDLDDTVIAAGMVLGSLAAVFLSLGLREAGASRLMSYGAGVLLAIQPAAVRFSGNASRQAQVALLGTLAIWALARFGRLHKVSLLVVFAASAWLCYRTRPEAVTIIGLSGLFVLIVHMRGSASLRDRNFRRELVAVFLTGVLFVAGFVATRVLEPEVGQHLGMAFTLRFFLTPEDSLWLDSDYTSVAVMGLFFAGLLFTRPRHRIVLWALPSLLICAYLGSLMPSGGLLLASARYQTLAVVIFCVIAAHGLDQLVERSGSLLTERARPVVLTVIVLLVAGTSIAPMAAVTAPRTVDYEYRFVRRVVRELPPNARIVYTRGPHENSQGGLMTPIFLSSMFGLDEQRWALWPDAEGERTPDTPRYYYHAAQCSVSEDYLRDNYGETSVGTLRRCREALARVGGPPPPSRWTCLRGAWTTKST